MEDSHKHGQQKKSDAKEYLTVHEVSIEAQIIYNTRNQKSGYLWERRKWQKLEEIMNMTSEAPNVLLFDPEGACIMGQLQKLHTMLC